MSIREDTRMIYGFAEFVGRFLSILDEDKLKVLCTLVVHPQGSRWNEFVLRVGRKGGALRNILGKLQEYGFIVKDQTNVYYLTDWGQFAFNFCYGLAVRLSKMQSPPPYMDYEEFHQLKRLTGRMISYLMSQGYEPLYKMTLPKMFTPKIP